MAAQDKAERGAMQRPDIVVTRADFERLLSVLDEHADNADQRAVETLDRELARASVVPPSEMPPNVVTMNSRVRYFDRDMGESRTVTLVYPAYADSEAGRLSVLAPVGCALLGLTVGQMIKWSLPDGRVRSFDLAEILYQPEAAGDAQL